AEVLKFDDGEVKLKAYGTVSGRIILNARLTLTCYNLADRNPSLAVADRATVRDLRQQLFMLQQSRVDLSAPTTKT
ncbi:MAG: hypothetical protein ABFC54_02645, partial [Thermoguttaceae bacterium]